MHNFDGTDSLVGMQNVIQLRVFVMLHSLRQPSNSHGEMALRLLRQFHADLMLRLRSKTLSRSEMRADWSCVGAVLIRVGEAL